MILDPLRRHEAILDAIEKKKALLADYQSYNPIPDPLKGKGHMGRVIWRLDQEIAELEEEDRKLLLQAEQRRLLLNSAGDDRGRWLISTPEHNADPASAEPAPLQGTKVGRNIDRLRKECGWSLNECERWTGLDKKLIRGHISGKNARPKTLRMYADAFSRGLKRTVTVAELES